MDTSEDHHSYIEDCYVCCRPIQFTVICEGGELVSIEAARE
ncbi:MAG: CPXCG motif-containing cysteine-rich protein [Bacteriovoracia bacterium]